MLAITDEVIEYVVALNRHHRCALLIFALKDKTDTRRMRRDVVEDPQRNSVELPARNRRLTLSLTCVKAR